MEKISEQTLIPIGVAVVVIGAAALWISSINLQTKSNTETINKLEVKQEKYSDDMRAIRESLAEINGALREIKRRN